MKPGNHGNRGMEMTRRPGLPGVIAGTTRGTADDTPKHGGIPTWMIPADVPPGFDGHCRTSYATAPLCRVPLAQTPSSTASEAAAHMQSISWSQRTVAARHT